MLFLDYHTNTNPTIQRERFAKYDIGTHLSLLRKVRCARHLQFEAPVDQQNHFRQFRRKTNSTTQ